MAIQTNKTILLEVRISVLIMILIIFIYYSVPGVAQNVSNSKVKIDSNYTVKLSDGVIVNGSLIESSNKMPLLILISPPLTQERRYRTHYSTYGKFRYLAMKFAEQGFGVYWFDNRGMGLSQGRSDSVTLYTHARDVQNIVDHFKKKRPFRKIGLIGHSEGGSVAEVVASSRFSNIDMLVLLSVMHLSGYDAFKFQTRNKFTDSTGRVQPAFLKLFEQYNRVSRSLFKVLETHENIDSLKIQLKQELEHDYKENPTGDERVGQNTFNSIYETWIQPHQLALRKFVPDYYVAQIRCPILTICGELDDLVDCHPNLDSMRVTLERVKHSDFEAYAIPNVNHSFRTFESGFYRKLKYKDELFSQVALEKIISWLKIHE